jgi:RNA polymerase sigma factor (sigma-70 family)
VGKPHARYTSPLFRQTVGRPRKSEAERRRSDEAHADDIDLLRAWRKRGDKQAYATLVQRHMGLVGLMVKREMALPQNVDDLMQEGAIGLMKGLEKYDERHGTKITTYVSYWIRAYILDHLMKTNTGQVRLGKNARALFFQINRARRDIENRGEEATAEAIAKAIGVSPKTLRYMGPRIFGAHDVCLDDEDTFLPLSDQRPSPESVVLESDWRERVRAVVRETINNMRPLARQIICERFFMKRDEQRTLKEIGDDVDLSRERIRQIEKDALSELRAALVARLGEHALRDLEVLEPAA